jgi:hypothetical protein
MLFAILFLGVKKAVLGMLSVCITMSRNQLGVRLAPAGDTRTLNLQTRTPPCWLVMVHKTKHDMHRAVIHNLSPEGGTKVMRKPKEHILTTQLNQYKHD